MAVNKLHSHIQLQLLHVFSDFTRWTWHNEAIKQQATQEQRCRNDSWTTWFDENIHLSWHHEQVVCIGNEGGQQQGGVSYWTVWMAVQAWAKQAIDEPVVKRSLAIVKIEKADMVKFTSRSNFFLTKKHGWTVTGWYHRVAARNIVDIFYLRGR